MGTRNEKKRALEGQRHVNGDWCVGATFRCNNPVHWAMGKNKSLIGMPRGEGWELNTYRYVIWPRNGGWPWTVDSERGAVQSCLDELLTTQSLAAYTAIAILAFCNPDYAEYKKLVRRLYQTVTGNTFRIP